MSLTKPQQQLLQKRHQQNNSFSKSNIQKRSMSSRNSPLRKTTERFYAKRSAKRSFSESSADKLHRYTTSDTSTTQEEEEDGNVFCYTNIFGEHSHYVSDMIDIGIRVALVVIFSKLETQTAFKRIIHSEEMWMYKNPRTKDFVSPVALLFAVILGPFCTTLIHLGLTKDRRDFRAASWTWTLILGVNGLFTSLLKISVGRPRPDFYYRCFPDGIMQITLNATGADNVLDLFNCTGSVRDINEGHKSFPSGHSSFAFAGFGFIAYYVGAKLHAFNHRGRGESWRLFVSLTPLVLAALIAVSRTCDYHHHWEDVTIGSLLGLFVSYLIYRQYYPSIFSHNCHRAYPRDVCSVVKAKTEHFIKPHSRRRLQSYKRVSSEVSSEESVEEVKSVEDVKSGICQDVNCGVCN